MERLEQYLDKKYILKEGRLLYYNNTHFNNDTITDKIAEKAIGRFPALVGAFISERERDILEAKVKGRGSVSAAEKSLKDENLEKRIGLFIEAGEYEEAKKHIDDLAVDETRDRFLAEIEKAEEAIKADAEAKKKAKADKKAAEAKAKKDAEDKKKAEAEKEAKDKADAVAKKNKAEEDKKKAEAEKKKKADEAEAAERKKKLMGED